MDYTSWGLFRGLEIGEILANTFEECLYSLLYSLEENSLSDPERESLEQICCSIGIFNMSYPGMTLNLLKFEKYMLHTYEGSNRIPPKFFYPKPWDKYYGAYRIEDT